MLMNKTTPTTTVKVELYTSHYCGYCVRAKALLERKGVAYIEYYIDDQPERVPEMVERAEGARSVPQIFIADRHIGGCDELYQLERRGVLDGLLGLGDQQP